MTIVSSQATEKPDHTCRIQRQTTFFQSLASRPTCVLNLKSPCSRSGKGVSMWRPTI